MPMPSLAHLPNRTRARVVRVSPERKRLLALGLRPGAVVEVLLRAPLGDPLEVRAGDAFLLLRLEEARHVQVEVL
ncbi:FeoA family protein [Thermus thermophilus]|uniref:FeoA family protein n=2 Tax=Thermus thermophilus TaxID=274 RepID=UPI001A9CB241|nr:FeoA family protein [Thermus thermophilus]